MIEGARAVKIRWLGQAGFLLSWHSNNLLIDPWFAPHRDRLAPPPSLEDLPTDITALLATHEHGDHLDLATAADACQPIPSHASGCSRAARRSRAGVRWIAKPTSWAFVLASRSRLAKTATCSPLQRGTE